jgi:hypothetical protein
MPTPVRDRLGNGACRCRVGQSAAATEKLIDAAHRPGAGLARDPDAMPFFRCSRCAFAQRAPTRMIS